ncbi:MAG: rhomboid family intramembrane serine protease [Acidobacteriota bacterium]|nr:rhomboid family intramembrane serine protease [Acidobacteriota bacterium]
MFRRARENRRFVFVLLFLNVAFFLLEHQDRAKYARLFAFHGPSVSRGELWRLFTYQFTQPGSGVVEALSLFITLVLLYMMGSALEEEWGSGHFAMLFLVSTLSSAAVASWIGIPLLGTYFVYFTLLFVYAAAFPQQTFYFFGAVPVPVRLLAFFSFAVLLYGVVSGGAPNVAALAGAICGFLYYLSQRVRVKLVVVSASAPREEVEVKLDPTTMRNAARFVAIRQAIARGGEEDINRLAAQCETEAVANVNICPPADYKPDNVDGYCLRCEGFAECSARHLRMQRPATV